MSLFVDPSFFPTINEPRPAGSGFLLLQGTVFFSILYGGVPGHRGHTRRDHATPKLPAMWANSVK
jgi:hypothetical protein